MILPLTCVCVALSAPAGAMTQEDVKLQVPLHYVAFKDLQEMVRLTGGGLGNTMNRARDVAGYVLPKELHGGWLTKLQVQALGRPVVAAFGMKASPAKAVRVGLRAFPVLAEVWLDLRGDHKFTNDEKYKARNAGDFTVFGPIAADDSDGNPVRPFYLTSRYSYYVGLTPAGYYAGEVDLGGKTVKIGLVDANVDGILGERMFIGTYGGPGGDIMLIDFKGDGEFDAGAPSDMTRIVASEVRPITWLMQMPDRRFYHLRVADDGSSVTLERSGAELGAVAAKCSKLALELDGPDGPLFTYPQESPLALPPGGYRVMETFLSATDKDGKDWIATVGNGEDRTGLVRVKSGKTVDLPYGGGLKIELETNHYRDAYSVSMPMTDGFGNGVIGLTKPDGTRPIEPKLKIVDASGGTVFAKNFSYG